MSGLDCSPSRLLPSLCSCNGDAALSIIVPQCSQAGKYIHCITCHGMSRLDELFSSLYGISLHTVEMQPASDSTMMFTSCWTCCITHCSMSCLTELFSPPSVAFSSHHGNSAGQVRAQWRSQADKHVALLTLVCHVWMNFSPPLVLGLACDHCHCLVFPFVLS